MSKKDEMMLEVMESMELYFPEDCDTPKKKLKFCKDILDCIDFSDFLKGNPDILNTYSRVAMLNCWNIYLSSKKSMNDYLKMLKEKSTNSPEYLRRYEEADRVLNTLYKALQCNKFLKKHKLSNIQKEDWRYFKTYKLPRILDKCKTKAKSKKEEPDFTNISLSKLEMF